MADVYQFSKSSLELLGRCIGAAKQPETKWMNLFKKQSTVEPEDISFSDEDTIMPSPKSDIELDEDEQPEQEIQETQNDESNQIQIERIAAILEAEPSNKIDYLAEQCNNDILPALVERLSAECLEIICEDLLENSNFHEEILKHFVAAYISKETSFTTLNLLVKAFKTHRATLLTLMESLFVKIDISSKLLEEFFSAIDKSAQSQFLQTISVKELPTDVFIQRINIINQLYKSNEKNNNIQNFLLNELLKSSQPCQENKNYGRCLLTFFQGLQEHDQIARQTLERLINCHQTPFKRLCQSILNNLYKVQT